MLGGASANYTVFQLMVIRAMITPEIKEKQIFKLQILLSNVIIENHDKLLNHVVKGTIYLLNTTNAIAYIFFFLNFYFMKYKTFRHTFLLSLLIKFYSRY